MPSFDAASALIVRHATPEMGGAMPIAESGSLRAGLTRTLDYDSRVGVWEEKGGCDRSMTQDDLELERASLVASAQLDYVSREGEWEHKGEGRMVDCSFFGQDGAVPRDQVERDLIRCGGCYMRSLVTVRREDAALLGLDSKRGFEDLLRSTWRRGVTGDRERGIEGWGVTDAEGEVRWVANFHTDQENNLHCHVTTWFEHGYRDFSTPGWCVSAKGSRGQREITYEHAYRRPMRDMVYPEKDFAREWALACARAELGIPRTRSQERRFQRLAREAGMAGRLPSRTVSGPGAERVQSKVEGMREVFDRGRGLKGSSHVLGAAARDVHKALLDASRPYAEAVAMYRSCVEVQADAKGLSVPSGREEREAEEPRAAEVVGHLRDRFVRRQMEELVGSRLVPAIERAADVERARAELVREASRDVVGFREVREAVSPRRETALLSRDESRELAKAFSRGDADAMTRAVERVCSSGEVRGRIEEVAERVGAQMSGHGLGCDPEVVREEVAERVRGFVGRVMESSAEGIAREQEGREVYSASREVMPEVRDVLMRAATTDGGLGLGLTIPAHAEVAVSLAEAGALMAGGAEREDPEVAELLERVAEAVAESPVVGRRISELAGRVASEVGSSVSEAEDRLREGVRATAVGQAAAYAPVAFRETLSPAPAMDPGPALDCSGLAADLVVALAEGLCREQVRDRERKRERGVRQERGTLEIARER